MPALSKAVKSLIDLYDLEEHPEGGYFTETYRADQEVDTPMGPRSASTAIKFLVTKNSVSRLHRIESDEVWHFYEGGPMSVIELDTDEPGHVRTTVLGPDDLKQYVVKAGTWFGSHPNSGTDYSLVGCTVSPGFDFQDFELASPAGLKAEFPKAKAIITKLTKGLTDKNSTNTNRPKGADKPPKVMAHPVFRTSPNEKPRQLMLSLACFCGIVYYSAANRKSSLASDQEAFQTAIVFVFIAFEMFIFLQVRDLLTIWPHPGFWRLVFGFGAFYALILVSMLMLDFTRSRWVLEAILGDIGSYADYERKTQEVAEVMSSCKMTWNTAPTILFNQIFGAPWFLSHALGWMGKMMIFRDWKVCLIAALLFEFTEMTLSYVCPEFEECWWDSIFLDTFGANLLGMWMGTHVNRFIVGYSKDSVHSIVRGGDAMHVGATLDWAGKEDRSAGTEKLASMLNPLIHDSTYKWTIFKNPLRLFQVAVLIAVMLFIETNTFLMMNTMGIPHDAWYNKVRLALFGFMSIPAAAEWYVYIEQTARAGHDAARIGPACWLCFCVALLENCLFWKFFPKHFVAELDKLHGFILVPTNTLTKHLCAWVLFLTWAVLRYKVVGYGIDEEELDSEEKKIISKLVSSRKNRGRLSIIKAVPATLHAKFLKTELVDLLLYASLLPLLCLYTEWKWV
ncbi:hypothetical protein TL16_g02238 [Triparma laevis f. inornata]|uniref:DUF985 domain-containing protein n=1 Tax=Triparma laevis f. inornata TaxID=1714386 RepID=A0A9W6ZM21_9STRA|nr:hypothetical protein TL16_g02238 [Triparma laevis f. inornata]